MTGSQGRSCRAWLVLVMAALMISGLMSPFPIATADEDSMTGPGPGYVGDVSPPEVQPVDFAVRIAARLTADERIEFGIQLLDRNGGPGALLLPQQRFFPLSITHHEWLKTPGVACESLPYTDSGADLSDERLRQFKSTKVQIRARVHPTRHQVEFALRHELPAAGGGPPYSDPMFPEKRFFPGDVSHHKWLYSSDILFTILYGAEGYMAGDATMDSVDGSIQPRWVDIYEYRDSPTPLPECLSILDAEGPVFMSGGCIIPMIRHCRDHRDILECRNFRRLWPMYAVAIDIDESEWP